MMRKDFNAAARPEGSRPERNVGSKLTNTTTISLRVTYEEKARLENAAGNMALGPYLREQLLGKDLKPRKSRSKHPIKDREALGRVLGRLGRSDIALAIGALLLAVEEQRLYVDDEQESLLRQINNDVIFMRINLIKALGLKAG